MPQKYARPRLRGPTRREHIVLTDDQRIALARCGIDGEALQRIELLAKQALHDEAGRWPVSRGEIEAALRILHSKTVGLLDAIKTHDDYQLVDLADFDLLNEQTGELKYTASLTAKITKDLEDFKRAIDHAQATNKTCHYVEHDWASLVRRIFEHFGIPFNRSKRSRAIKTLWTILRFVDDRTTLATAESRIRAAMKFPRYEFSGTYVGTAMTGLVEPPLRENGEMTISP